jgi:hypothetical protein
MKKQVQEIGDQVNTNYINPVTRSREIWKIAKEVNSHIAIGSKNSITLKGIKCYKRKTTNRTDHISAKCLYFMVP